MEIDKIKDNMSATFDMTFDEDLPVLILAAENKNEIEEGKTNESFYQMYLEDLDQEKLVVLAGSHYLHHDYSSKIAEETKAFLE